MDVSAEIRGPLPRPELRLTSVPALTESQIFTVMLTGEADVDSLDPEEAQAQAASLLAAVSSPALQRQLNDRLKVDRIGVGVGGDHPRSDPHRGQERLPPRVRGDAVPPQRAD